MKINRVWAMPNKWTFKIKPIAELLRQYNVGRGWVDPFAGMNSPAEFRNDLNPDANAEYHIHALDFVNRLSERYNGLIFDPPYNLSQLKECYNGFGIEHLTQNDIQYFPNNVRDVMVNKIKANGYCISFGWSTVGIGLKNGFKIIEILLVPHGGKHYDTIVTVEQKIRDNHELDLK